MADNKNKPKLTPGVAVALVDHVPDATDLNQNAINSRINEISAGAQAAGLIPVILSVQYGSGNYIITYRLERNPCAPR